MKKYLPFLLLLLQLPTRASQIGVGLQPENLVAWGVWEREGKALKHYLLLYNRSQQALDVEIRLNRYTSDARHLTEVKKSKTFYHYQLAVHQLVQLPYPRSSARGRVSELLEYVENGTRIGATELNSARPTPTVLQSPGYRFYANEGVNSGLLTYWVAFESIYAMPTHIQITAANKFFSPSRFLREEYHLVRAYPTLQAAYQRPGTLDSLAAASHEATIIRLDSLHQTVSLPIRADFATPGLTLLGLYTEFVEDSYVYDEQKRLVSRPKLYGGSAKSVPVFVGQPTRPRRAARP